MVNKMASDQSGNRTDITVELLRAVVNPVVGNARFIHLVSFILGLNSGVRELERGTNARIGVTTETCSQSHTKLSAATKQKVRP